jgi:hypothetical protein
MKKNVPQKVFENFCISAKIVQVHQIQKKTGNWRKVSVESKVSLDSRRNIYFDMEFERVVINVRAFRTSESADFSEVRVRKFRTLKTLRTRTQRVCLFTHLYCKEVNISQEVLMV